MNGKMIFFDIDGTIATEGDHRISTSTRDAIRRARENGHLTFINTGRTFFTVTEEIRELGFDGYVCGCGTYVRLGEELLVSRSIPHETCVEIVGKLRECRVEAMFEGLTDVFFDGEEPATGVLASLKAKYGARGYDITKTWDSPGIVFDKFVVWAKGDSDFEGFHDYITREFTYIDRGGNFGEIIPKGFDKGTGIDVLRKHLGIRLEDCYAIGDSTNDLPMLEAVPNSIAMGNSMVEILDKVAFVTRDIEEDGIAHALEHFGII
ncbi:HAD family hydrolase [Anaerotalea alkaliphila]|uniref:HAD family phosphatase n=1 Tax=Anaerotalea alkaliphila TaxID=2662126 RepID=A0A7X5KP99_9FIRM|nr:HAD family hydrolase [Anaerotalea alkaliphila]NDL68793.1 HAD family phosphatase [Anaerotalea alkaliphila]